MKKTIVIGLLFLMCLLLCISASAIGETMNAVRGTPVIDGEYDKLWEKADRQKLSYPVGGDKMARAGRSSAFVSALWDDEAIYFLFEIIDDDFILTESPESGLNDAIHLFIDEADCFGPTWQKGQSKVILTPALGKSLYPAIGDGPSSYEMAWKFEDESHCYIEFKYVPTGLKLNDSAQVLMDFRYDDMTQAGTMDYSYSWSDEIGEAETDSASWSYVRFRLTSSGGKQSSGLKEAAASINRTPYTDYKPMRGTDGNKDEDYDKIWDLDTHTKFCTSTFPMESIVRLGEEISIDGLLMATANDNESYHDRNPCGWQLQGSGNGHDWETIVSGDDTFFDEVNFTYFAMTIEPTKPYRYLRFYNTGAYSGCCQISEVTVCSTADLEAAPAAEVTEEPVRDPSRYESSMIERVYPGDTDAAQSAASAASVPRHFSDVPGIVMGVIAAAALVGSLFAMVILRKREQ